MGMKFDMRNCLTLIAGVVLLVMSFSAQAARHALVIGNSGYGSGFDLATPLHDSTAVAQKLSSIGYQVHGGGARLNLDLEAFDSEIESFIDSIEDGSTALIYYAGHGAASRGANYLIPILPEGVRLRTDSDVRNRSILLQSVVERVERKNPNGVNVYFFDACRDGPVQHSTRNINLTGLTNIDTVNQPRGSFIGFSTEYGRLALDGDDPNGHSPFAAALLESLTTHAATPIELFFKAIVEKVFAITQGQQHPIQESKIRGELCIIECREENRAATPQEFGTPVVLTKPANAEVCYLIESWSSWNCFRESVLPLNTPVQIRVTAKSHKTFTTDTEIMRDRQRIPVTLERKGNNTLKIVGGVAAAVIIGGLLVSGSDSGGGGDSDEIYNISITPPQ